MTWCGGRALEKAKWVTPMSAKVWMVRAMSSGGAEGVVGVVGWGEGHGSLISVLKGFFGDVLGLGAGFVHAEVELDGLCYGGRVPAYGLAVVFDPAPQVLI